MRIIAGALLLLCSTGASMAQERPVELDLQALIGTLDEAQVWVVERPGHDANLQKAAAGIVATKVGELRGGIDLRQVEDMRAILWTEAEPQPYRGYRPPEIHEYRGRRPLGSLAPIV